MSKSNPVRAPFYSKDQLEYWADQHTEAFSRLDSDDDLAISVFKFAKHYLGKSVRFEWLSHNNSILGLSSFAANTRIPVYIPEQKSVTWLNLGPDTILLSKKFDGEFIKLSQARFTLMHECAHQLLHKSYYQRKAAEEDCASVAYSIQRNAEDRIKSPDSIWTDEDRLEWQANYLAGALLMPSIKVQELLDEGYLLSIYQDRVNRGESESRAFESLVSQVANGFIVSSTTAKIRLQNMKFKRLPDQEKKPDSHRYFFLEPTPVIKTAKEIREDKILADWEDKFLNPDYVFNKKPTKASRLRRAARAKRRSKEKDSLPMV